MKNNMQKYTCEKCGWKIEEPNTYPKIIFQGAIEAHKNNFCKNKKTRHEMIKAIYEKIADKTLSPGCRIKTSHYSDERTIKENEEMWEENGITYFNEMEELQSIIGHPIKIGRIDILIDKGPNYFDEWIKVLDVWEKKDDIIEEQSDKCIRYIYNLIK